MKRGQSISQMMTPLLEEKRRLKAKIESLQVETGKIQESLSLLIRTL
jgi:hypothetical protein